MRTTATDLKNHLGRYLETAIEEPVIVEKSGRPSAVLVSFSKFEKLSQYEDFYWGEMAKRAETSGYLGVEETANWLQKGAKRAGIRVADGNEET
jgi:antitoxin Phd